MKRTLIPGAALAAAATMAFAQGPGYGQGMMGGPGMMGGGMIAALKLTDEQRDKVFAIQEEHRKKVDALRQQMLDSRIETHNQIVAVLTPEQRKQLRQHAPLWSGDGEQ
jgi:Spy/CpxP family protein refolding chaperone